MGKFDDLDVEAGREISDIEPYQSTHGLMHGRPYENVTEASRRLRKQGVQFGRKKGVYKACNVQSGSRYPAVEADFAHCDVFSRSLPFPNAPFYIKAATRFDIARSSQ
jgi:hypothetical protein